MLKVTFATGLGAGILGTLGAVASFLFPMTRDDPSTVLLGDAGKFPVGSKTFFEVSEEREGLEATVLTTNPQGAAEKKTGARGLWLVRLEAGFLALLAKCTHLGCDLPWNANFTFVDPATGADKRGWFRCPCHAATFNDAGNRVYGPAPRSMDRFDLRVVNGDLYADFRTLRKGTNDNAKYAVNPKAKI